MGAIRLYHAILALCVFSPAAFAQTEEKAWSLSIDSVTVRGSRYTSPLKTNADGTILWNMRMMDDLPKIMGNADPIHYAQMLPGIQTNNEYKSGINIQGCDNSHNLIAIGGVPVYNASHLLGFFSTFNASHYPSLSLTKSAATAEAPNRLGGLLSMSVPDQIPDSLNGELSVGLISSQGTLRLPIGRATALTVSLRASYLTLLYSRWLNADGLQIKYAFYDANATLVHHADERNALILDIYSGNDRMSVSESDYFADMSDTWGNRMAALHWNYDNPGSLSMRSCLYVTNYHNQFRLDMQGMEFRLPSRITDIGLNTTVEWKRWKGGAELIWHDIHPQELRTSGTPYSQDNGKAAAAHTAEASLHADYMQPLLRDMYAVCGIRASRYWQKGTSFHAIDPSLSLRYDDHTWQMGLSLALRRQYLFQTGFSNIGLPSEFWMSCNRNHPPQKAGETSVSLSRYLFHRRYRLTADAYYRRLYNQVEYSGSVLDYMNTAYDIEQSLLYGDGENYGYSLMLNKCSGKLTGWIAYAYSQARRTFADLKLQGSYPACHDRPHEVNAVVTYAPWKHWNFGATFVYASGTPFTAPHQLAFINGNILIEYGDHNANRLKPYSRLDLSVNYKWKTRLLREQGLNLSVYNALASKNELFYYIRSYESGAYAYQPVTFAIDILPSISYFCKF